MKRRVRSFAVLTLPCLLALLPSLRADVALPANMSQPGTAVEAWNIIHLATANLDKLVAEPRLQEVAIQASLCNPALRALAAQPNLPELRSRIAEFTQGASLALTSLVQACSAGDVEEARLQLKKHHAAVDTLKTLFDPRIAAGAIYFCAMHPEVISENAYQPCDKCAMRLHPRRIPHSFVYVPPGESTMQMTFAPGLKLTAGQRAEVNFKLARRDGLPVMLRDLMVMHSQPIHLLIVDAALRDYHHEHPVPTPFSQVPANSEPWRTGMCGPLPRGSGEYTFSFTPRASGSYRIFADLVPLDSGIQEYVRTELPGAEIATGSVDAIEKLAAEVEGMTFRLSLVDERGAPLRARHTRAMQITVTDGNGQPMTRLEPFMNAFAHLVAFHEDGRTVLHLHPEGGDVLRADVRGGPFLNFRFHAPKEGFLRLFCQVQVEGRQVMAPFGVKVAE